MGRAIQGEGPTSSGHRDRVLGAEVTRPPGSSWAQPYKGALALGQKPCTETQQRALAAGTALSSEAHFHAVLALAWRLRAVFCKERLDL